MGFAYGTAEQAGGAGEGPASRSPARAGGEAGDRGPGRRGLARGGRKRRRLRRWEPLSGLVWHPGCSPECGDGLGMRLQGPDPPVFWADGGPASPALPRRLWGAGGGAAVPGKQLRSGEGERGERERERDGQTAVVREDVNGVN